MAQVSFLKWPDFLVDFGLNLYVSWRLSEGDVLYRDVVYYYGPLSQYLHAFLFSLFKVHVQVLELFNLGITAGLAFLIYGLFLKIADRLTATLVSLTFILLCAFSQYLAIGNYNFVTPYRYELTHGVALGFLAIFLLAKYLETRPRPGWLCGLSLTVGLVLLTKTETAVAVFGAVLPALIWVFYQENKKPKRVFGKLILTAVGIGLPSLGFFLYFGFHMPWSQAAGAMLEPWKHTLSPVFRSFLFYKMVMGTDAPWENFKAMVVCGLGLGGAILLCLAANHLLSRSRWPSRIFLGIWFSALLFFSFKSPEILSHMEMFRALPLVSLGFVGAASLHPALRRTESPEFARALLNWTLGVFSLLLLLKTFLHARIVHYGFALSLPAVLLLVKIIVYDLSRWAKKISKKQEVYLGMALALIGIMVGNPVAVSVKVYRYKNLPIIHQGEVFYEFSPLVNKVGIPSYFALQQLSVLMKPHDRLVTFPEGIIFNYLLRKKALAIPTYTPVDEKLYGIQTVLDQLKAHAPEYLMVLKKDFHVYGKAVFGKDYGVPIYRWILDHYSILQQFGDHPVEGDQFGILLFKRNENARPPATIQAVEEPGKK